MKGQIPNFSTNLEAISIILAHHGGRQGLPIKVWANVTFDSLEKFVYCLLKREQMVAVLAALPLLEH